MRKAVRKFRHSALIKFKTAKILLQHGETENHTLVRAAGHDLTSHISKDWATASIGNSRSALGANRLEFGHAACPPSKEREAEHASHSRGRAASAAKAQAGSTKVTVCIRER